MSDRGRGFSIQYLKNLMDRRRQNEMLVVHILGSFHVVDEVGFDFIKVREVRDLEIGDQVYKIINPTIMNHWFFPKPVHDNKIDLSGFKPEEDPEQSDIKVPTYEEATAIIDKTASVNHDVKRKT